MTTLTETSRSEVVQFVSTSTAEDLRTIKHAIKAREQALRAAAATTMGVGTTVTLSGLSPQYLNGMTGEVRNYSRNRNRVEVRLDAPSTRALAARSTRFFVPSGQTHYDLAGVPVSCISRPN